MNNALIRINNNDTSNLKDLNSISINSFFNLKEIVKSIETNISYNINNINNISYKYISNNSIKATKKINYKFLELIKPLYSGMDVEMSNYLKQSIEINNIEELVLYSLIEINIVISLLEEDKITFNEFFILLKEINYIDKKDLDKTKFLMESNKKWKNGTSKIRNTNLLVKNKYAYELPKDYSKLINIDLKNSIYILNLPLVEIPGDKEDINLISFFDNFNKVLKTLKLKQNNFNLRIRKLGKSKKNGLFIVNSNTIILDPRYPEVIYHELGHFIYETKLSFTFDDRRYYYSNFNQFIAKFKKNNNVNLDNKHEMEKYSNNSEIFAYWFESLFKVKVY